MDLLMNRLDYYTKKKAAMSNIVQAMDSHMTCEVCGNTGHSGNNCPETQEDVLYMNDNNNGYHPQGGQGWNQQCPYQGDNYGNSFNPNQPSFRDLIFGQAKINESFTKKLAANEKTLESLNIKLDGKNKEGTKEVEASNEGHSNMEELAELADSSVRYPVGIAKDILVKIWDCFVPIDFMVLDMDIDKESPLILGCSFLSTEDACIDVGAKVIRLHINGKEEKFEFRPRKKQCSMIKSKQGINTRIKEVEVTPPEMDSLISFMKNFMVIEQQRTNINIVFVLPMEFMAPADHSEISEAKRGMAQLTLELMPATFEKPKDEKLCSSKDRQCRYAEWISNVVPVYKKNGNLGVCIDFRDLTKAMLMDGYPMPVADMLIDAAAGHRVISFRDGNAGYNQIFMAEEDISKIAFRCPRHIGLFEWIVMTFGLKNDGATYQWAMNYIFHELIGKIVEIYIDDVVVKSEGYHEHLANLHRVLKCTRKYGLKMNPNKCAFGVSAGQFLGFMVHEHGIKVSQKIIGAINKVVASKNKTELQSLIGKINFIRRFISNLSVRIQPFSSLLKLKADQEFVWGVEQQKALDDIKRYLLSPPVLVPPQEHEPFKLYLSADERAIGLALVQEFEEKERVIYYVSRRLLDVETRYSPVERLCLWLYFSCTKLRHYLLSAECVVVCKDDVVKYMLSLLILNGRIGKWILALSEFDLKYELAKAIKGQVMADFVVQHCGLEVAVVEPVPWTLFFDGSSCGVGSGIGIVLVSPREANYEFSLQIDTTATNNKVEYQAILKGIKLLREIKVDAVEIFGDSMLVVNQLTRGCECRDDILRVYHEKCLQLLKEFKSVTIEHIPRSYNEEANKLAQNASGY
nr:uncharacterized protein LOC117844153 [Setaria viridis]